MSPKEIIINGTKIEYVEKRASDGPIVVFLHGWASNFSLFNSLLEDTENYIAFNFPGVSTPLSEAWTLADYTALTHNFLQKKCPDDEIIFVVHSFGGRVLLKLLDGYDYSRTRHIICTGVPFIREIDNKRNVVQGVTKVAKVGSSILPKGLSNKLRTAWYGAIGASDYEALESDVMKETFRNIIEEDVNGLTDAFSAYKTDFIWGRDDTDAPLAQAKTIAEKTDTPLHIIADAGHFAFIAPHDTAFKKILTDITRA